MRRLLSVVVSVYNEEEALAQFYQVTEGILNTISWDYELVFVNDGSSGGILAAGISGPRCAEDAHGR